VSSLLFSLFINDLPDTLSKEFSDLKIHLYADDTQIYFSFPPEYADIAIERMNKILKLTND
jgi:Reverse transcriptase (RNA-dependent DNA polymerase)